MKVKFKYILFTLCSIALTISCRKMHEETQDVNIEVSTEYQVYKIGEPVSFKINSNADFLTFYSGEEGAKYEYHDVSRVVDAGIALSFMTSTSKGLAGAPNPSVLPISYSADFSGIYTEEEMAFARKIQDSLSMEVCARDRKTYGTDGPMFEGVADRNLWEKAPMKASTGTGDVSYIMPMNLFTAASWPVGVAPHTWQAAACAGSSIGEKAALYAAKVIAATASDLATSPEDQEKIRKEFEQRRPDNYVPMYEG
jgi:hypothetical protein